MAYCNPCPRLAVATEGESLFFIKQWRLMGGGIEYIDVHLLAGPVMHGARLWTKDKRLRLITEEKAWAHVVEGY